MFCATWVSRHDPRSLPDNYHTIKCITNRGDIATERAIWFWSHWKLLPVLAMWCWAFLLSTLHSELVSEILIQGQYLPVFRLLSYAKRHSLLLIHIEFLPHTISGRNLNRGTEGIKNISLSVWHCWQFYCPYYRFKSTMHSLNVCTYSYLRPSTFNWLMKIKQRNKREMENLLVYSLHHCYRLKAKIPLRTCGVTKKGRQGISWRYTEHKLNTYYC